MKLPLIDIVVIVCYFAVTLTIGLISSARVKSQKDFYIGGRSFGKFLIMMQQFGAGTSNTHPILVASQVYVFGIAGIWYSWMYMLLMPLWFVLLPLIRRLRTVTTPDYFDLRYSKGIAPFFSIYCLLNVSLAAGMIMISMGQTVWGVSQGGIKGEYAIIATGLIGIGYSFAGGMIAAAITDVIQGILIIVLSFMLIPPMWKAAGGLAGLHAVVPIEKFSLAMPRSSDPSKTIDLFAIIVLACNAMLGNLVEGTVQTHQAAKNERSLQLGNLFGAMLKRTCTIGWALVGLFAIAIWPKLSDPEMCFGRAAHEFLPPGFSGLMIAALFAAAMGGLSAMQVIASAVFTRNIYSKYIMTKQSDGHYLLVARFCGVMIIVGGIIAALRIGNVRETFNFWMRTTAMVGPAMIIAMFWRRGTSWGAWGSIVISLLTWIFAQFILAPQSPDSKFYHFCQNILPYVPAFLHGGSAQWTTVWYQASLYIPAAVISYIVVSLLTTPEDSRKLDRFYARLNTPVGQEQILIDAGLEEPCHEFMPHSSVKQAGTATPKTAGVK